MILYVIMGEKNFLYADGFGNIEELPGPAHHATLYETREESEHDLGVWRGQDLQNRKGKGRVLRVEMNIEQSE